MSESGSTLDDRKAAILRALVAQYVSSGEPVGSKTLVERYELGVSPATVRNELASLEEGGYIFQPHTSAGRVPTDRGYRYFVDSMPGDAKLGLSEARRIRRFFGEPRWELEEALRETAGFLSGLTDHAAVVFAPALQRSVVRHVELVGLNAGRAMLVLVTDTGRVENHVVRVGDKMDEVQLEQTADMLNRIVQGEPLESSAARISGSIDRFPLELRATVQTVVDVLEEELAGESQRFFLEGTSNIVDEHKFSDLETVRRVIGALEHRRLLLELLADALSTGGVSVRIGSENAVEVMQSCSIIWAPYGIDGEAIGSLGVVGPTRMDYRRTMAAVYEVASELGRVLTERGA